MPQEVQRTIFPEPMASALTEYLQEQVGHSIIMDFINSTQVDDTLT
jgi:hypothetical protein